MRFLIDEMFPAAVCERLTDLGHDAAHVRDRGVNARPDREVADVARAEQRALVTENVKDFAREPDIVVVCVLKSRLAAHRMTEQLASMLDRWAVANPQPWIGLHWPADP